MPKDQLTVKPSRVAFTTPGWHTVYRNGKALHHFARKEAAQSLINKMKNGLSYEDALQEMDN